MTQRYDILSARESNGKSYFTKCGAMFPNKNGDGFNIMLDVMPASVDGQFRLIAKEPRERDDAPRGNGRAQSTPQRVDDLDEIPF